MKSIVSGLRRCVAGFAVAASLLLAGCATYPESYYYGDARSGGDYYYDEPYRAVDYDYYGYDDVYWPGAHYYSALWPVYSRWYDPFYFPGYYYGVTYFPRSWYGFSFSYFDRDPWWYSHHYSPYRYSWHDNYYSWHNGGRDWRRHAYRGNPRFGSARAEAERLASRSFEGRNAYAGASLLQRPDQPLSPGYADRARARDAFGRGADRGGTGYTARTGGYRTTADVPVARAQGQRVDTLRGRDGLSAAERRDATFDRSSAARDEMSRQAAARYGAPREASSGRTQAGSWRAGPREDSAPESYRGLGRGVPSSGYADRAPSRYGRGTVSDYPGRADPRPERRSRDSDLRFNSQRGYEQQRYPSAPRHEAPARTYERYSRESAPRYDAPMRGQDRGYAMPSQPSRSYDGRAYESRGGGGYAAPSRGGYESRGGGGYAAPSRGGYESRGSSGGGFSAPSGGGGYSAPAPAPSRGDSGSRSSDRGADRGRRESNE